MFIFGYFLLALARIINIALMLLALLIITRAVITWVRPNPYSRFVRLINTLSEPVLYQARCRIPLVYNGFDFSPFLVLLIIVFLKEFLVGSLRALALLLF